MSKNIFRFPYAIIIIIGIGVIGSILWWFLGADDDGTLAEIQQRGTFRVGLDASFPPFETMDGTGEIIGLDVDIAQDIADDLDVELEIVNIGFDGLYDALLARRVDMIISGLPYDPRWTQDVAYTDPYFNAGQVLMVPAESESFTLKGKTVAIEWGSQADMEGRKLAEEIEDLTLLRQASAAEAMETVLKGQAEAAIVDAVSGLSTKALKLETYLTDEWYVAAVHIESQALLEAVNHSLARLKESGQMAELQAQWLNNYR